MPPLQINITTPLTLGFCVRSHLPTTPNDIEDILVIKDRIYSTYIAVKMYHPQGASSGTLSIEINDGEQDGPTTLLSDHSISEEWSHIILVMDKGRCTIYISNLQSKSIDKPIAGYLTGQTTRTTLKETTEFNVAVSRVLRDDHRWESKLLWKISHVRVDQSAASEPEIELMRAEDLTAARENTQSLTGELSLPQ
ncbi:hypothetical protein CPB86DRAFT_820748 [Serendipita vermifera]|nr:hypothetical protein CPB86DRAFT_820748 [Serendipita vermifera]